MTGRPLEITNVQEEITGGPNFILIDREDLGGNHEEIGSLTNLRLPLEVNFVGEAANDYGGPRKEFLRLVLINIKEKYFDAGLIEDLAEDYVTCGVIMGLSVLQNGRLPQFLQEQVFHDLVNNPKVSACLVNLRKGLCKTGVYQVMVKLPLFQYLFRPSDNGKLSVKKLVHLLTPNFAEEGTNLRKHQKDVYNAWSKYIKEVQSGRRELGLVTLTLGHILQFVCGTDEEPVLGFALHPEIIFRGCDQSFLPTANTCICRLCLPCPSSTVSLPTEAELFKLYDYAFGS